MAANLGSNTPFLWSAGPFIRKNRLRPKGSFHGFDIYHITADAEHWRETRPGSENELLAAGLPILIP